MEQDTDKIDEAVLGLLWLTLHNRYRALKSMDWAALDRLHERGMIGGPKKQGQVGYLLRGGDGGSGSGLLKALRQAA